MIIKFIISAFFAASIFLTHCCVQADKPLAVQMGEQVRKLPEKSLRKTIGPDDSIADAMRIERAQGNKKTKLNIKSKMRGNRNGGKTFDIDVVEADSAVTSETTISTLDGLVQPVGDMGYSLLVTDMTEGDKGTVAILSVNLRTDEIQGVVKKKGQKAMKINQRKGKPSFADEDEEFIPPAWACGVTEKEKQEPSASSYHHLFGDRELMEKSKDYHHRNHEDHEYHHHDFEGDVASTIDSMRKALRGSNVQFGKRRKLQSGSYSYVVDMYIEIDNALVSKNGNSLSQAIQYVNTIITAANTVYEHEIATHLNVAHISLSTLYDSATSTSNALDKMRNTYGANTWHYAGIDLHHAMLGKSLGGGIAYLGVLCDSNWGYGLSASMSGSFVSINSAVVWDLMVVMHEIGHNFDSDHTHNYNPVIDTCGNSCPSGLPLQGSTTIMSYCHLCTGGYSNMMYTFGGDWTGTGDRSSVSTWQNNPGLNGNISNDPRRVSHTMWSHVSTRGACVATSNTPQPSPQPTPNPTNPPTPNPTMNNSPTPKPTTQAPTKSPNVAIYDSQLGAPKCTAIGPKCESGSLLNGRGTLNNGVELNRPNTIDNCIDGNSGSYHSDESIDKIVISSIDGEDFKVGTLITINATVYAWNTGSSDYADFYYSAVASNPATWVYITTKQPASGGLQTLSAQYTLQGGSSMQAIRVVFRYSSSGGSASKCPGGSYDDVDDLVFAVSLDGSPTKQPTQSPTRRPTSQPTKSPTNQPTVTGGGAQVALFDSQLGVPKCGNVGTSCDTGSSLIFGRAGLGPEPNRPNSLDSCTDGMSGTLHDDESIDRIIVRTNDGTDFKSGATVTIEASVWAWSSGTSDRADFYYAIDASSPNWVFIATKTPSGGGARTLSAEYTIPDGGKSIQAVRVNFRYQGTGETSCSKGSWDDVDDVAFRVGN